MTAEDLGLKYNDKADLQELINAANKDKEPEKQESAFLFSSYILSFINLTIVKAIVL